ncbi:MAG: FAD-binding protein [Cellvibrionales bacterium]|nr:FAD-binding protein [Cellvibrionales bacterium]
MLTKLIDKIRYRTPEIEDSMTVNPDTFHFDQETDLLIAGFGGAGATAAIEAHDQGLSTLVIDRFSGGGATNISGGIYYAGGGTRIQKEAGIEDSPENMFNYLKHEVRGVVKDETLKAFCDQSVENFDFMEANGVPFEASYCPFKTSYPPDHYFFYYSGNESFPPFNDDATPAARGHRGHRPGISGKAIYQPLKNAVRTRGVPVLEDTKLVGLLKDEQGKVIGIKATQVKSSIFGRLSHKLMGHMQILLRYIALFWPPMFNLLASLSEKIEKGLGESIYIKANKGVVLATGGFYMNQSMVKEHAPEYLGGSPLGTLTDDGSGINLAVGLGAKTQEMDNVSAWRFINPPASFAKGVMVGPTGERICNEMLYGAKVGEYMMKDHEGKAYIILNEELYKAAFKDLTIKKGLWFHVLLGYFFLKLGYKKANSLSELAGKLGINPDHLSNTLNDYNQMALSDQPDPLGKPKAFVQPIDGSGPYYAIDASYDYFYVPCPSLTLGGLAVDETSGMVMNEQDQPIEGLYAIGRTAVGIASSGYVSGLSIADCVFSGRRAAKHAANAKAETTKTAEATAG